MNVYDFDETILLGDSEVYFFKYVFENVEKVKKYQKKFKFYSFLEKKHILNLNKSRPKMYSFLKEFDENELEQLLENFWDKHQQYIKSWYYLYHKEDDIVSSATPSFILEPIMKRLNIKTLLATNMDSKTGKLNSKFNNKNQKVLSFKEKFDLNEIDLFFSDSDSDKYMAKCAKKAIKVVGNELLDWKL